MRRMQIYIKDEHHTKLEKESHKRKLAGDRKATMASLIRDALDQFFSKPKTSK